MTSNGIPPTRDIDGSCTNRRAAFLQKVQRCAAKLVAEEDCWRKHDIPSIPAERIIRHEYDPIRQKWSSEETIVKMEKEPFTHGAMRHCFRMKKLATPPESSRYHRFYKYGWSRASNYVAKAYVDEASGKVDTSDSAREAVKNDIKLQYESMRWANVFNEKNPPKQIIFIRAWAMEMPDRKGHPWFAIERFISGNDSYGTGFIKHNTNSGFVDQDLQRNTPQVFSAHSFYASNGRRLVADIQGVGDLYTDPQVLSNDYIFGDGDLGPRGMALFFHSFRPSSFSESLGLPVFPLSTGEKMHQGKQIADEDTGDLGSNGTLSSLEYGCDDEDILDGVAIESALSRFAALDMNRKARQSALETPLNSMRLESKDAPTEKRGNLRQSVSNSLRQSMRNLGGTNGSLLSKSTSTHRQYTRGDADDISSCFYTAVTDAEFDHRAYHRLESGNLKDTEKGSERAPRRMTIMRHVVKPMIPDKECRFNLGRVHYHLACLHGLGRFPEIVPCDPNATIDDKPSHDVFSVIFHLSHAASLRNVSACLVLARVRAGLDSTVSHLLKSAIPVNFESAKDLLGRAMESELSPSGPKAAAGCLLLQILEDEGEAGDLPLSNIVQDTLNFMTAAKNEADDLAAERAVLASDGGAQVGDKVEANYMLEGTYYSGVVTVVSEDGKTLTVKYDDDGSEESVTEENFRVLSGSATATNAPVLKGTSLTDEEALGTSNDDEVWLFEPYQLQAKLAGFKVSFGDKEDAASLYQEAANAAMAAGKMKSAAEYSDKAAELE